MTPTGTPRRRLEQALAALDLSWSVFSDFIIGSPPDEVTVDYVVIQPERGVALVDLAPHGSAEAVARFRELLDSERFAERFPGTLPVIRLVLEPTEVETVAAKIDEGFGRAKRLGIADPEWANTMGRLLVGPEELEPEAAAPPPIPTPVAPKPQAMNPPPGAPSGVARDRAPSGMPRDRTPSHDPAADLLRAAAVQSSPRAIERERPVLHVVREDGLRSAPPPRRRHTGAIAATLAILLGGAAGIAAMRYVLPENDQGAPQAVSIDQSATPDKSATTDKSAAADKSAATPPAPPAAETAALPAPAPEPPKPAPTVTAETPTAPAPAPPAPVVAAPAPEPNMATAPVQKAEKEPLSAPAATPAPAPREPAPTVAAAPPPPPPAPEPPKQTAAAPAAPVPTPGPQAKPADEAKPTQLVPRKPAAPKPPREATPVRTEPRAVAPAPESRPPVWSPPRAEAPAPRTELPTARAERQRSGPPVDASDLPPLENTPAPAPERAEAAPPSLDDGLSPGRPAPRGQREASVAPMPLPPIAGSSGTSTAPSRAPATDGRECRPYTSTTSLMGQERRVTGLACRLPDGRWKLVSENAE